MRDIVLTLTGGFAGGVVAFQPIPLFVNNPPLTVVVIFVGAFVGLGFAALANLLGRNN